MPEFPGVTHVALTVTDLERSRPWYEDLIGSPPVLDEDTGVFHHVVWLLGGQTLVGIHQFPDVHGSDPFDERRPGLDHVAFACGSRAELEQWESKLGELGIENGGIVDAPYGSGLSFRDPDNIALEFFAPPGSRRPRGRAGLTPRAFIGGCVGVGVAEGRRQSLQIGHGHRQRRMAAPPHRRTNFLREMDADTSIAVGPKVSPSST